jgi:uncharacterized protein
MNKARRMAALQSRELARAGYSVLRIDLLGCGDSAGEFADATWADWVQDVADAARWMIERHKCRLTIWGLRTGCLVAVEAAKRIAFACDYLFWQPTTSGGSTLQQFLRLAAAAQLQQGNGAATLERLRAELAAGRAIQVAGYTLSAALSSGLERAALNPPATAVRAAWLEVSTRADATLLPASSAKIQAWRAAGHLVHASVARGPAFWQTQEIEDAPELLSNTGLAMKQLQAA